MDPKLDETQAPAPTPAPAAEAPAPTPAPAAEPDVFADAFAEFNLDKPAAPAPTPAPAPEAKKPDGAAPAAGPDATPAPAPAPVASSASAEPTPTPAPAAPAGFVSQEEFRALQTRLDEALKPAAPAPTPAPAPEAPAPVYSADEQAAVDKYLTDWPDVARGEALQRRAEYQQLVQFIHAQYAPVIQELQNRLPAVEDDVQLRGLKDLIPDYDEVRDPVIEWVGKQPAYLKAAYEQVTGSGTPADIADLVTRFKKETGWVAPAAAPAPTPAPAGTPAAAAPAPAPAPTPAPAAAAPNAALPAAAVAAAASLKPVKTGRTEPTTAQDPNDFEAAWKEATSA